MKINKIFILIILFISIVGIAFSQEQSQSSIRYVSYNGLAFSLNSKYRINNSGDYLRKGFLTDVSTVQGIKLWSRVSLGIGLGFYFESTKKIITYPLLFDLRYYSSKFTEAGTGYVFIQAGKILNLSNIDNFKENQGTAKLGLGYLINDFNNDNNLSVEIFIGGTTLSFLENQRSNFLNTSFFGFGFNYIIN